jgi:hypothetical protein
VTGIRTDVELAAFLRSESPAFVVAWLAVCDGLASGEGDVSRYELFAGAARAALRGEDSVAFLRQAAGVVNDFYEESL